MACFPFQLQSGQSVLREAEDVFTGFGPCCISAGSGGFGFKKRFQKICLPRTGRPSPSFGARIQQKRETVICFLHTEKTGRKSYQGKLVTAQLTGTTFQILLKKKFGLYWINILM